MEKEEAKAIVLRFSAIIFLMLTPTFFKKSLAEPKNKLNKIIQE